MATYFVSTNPHKYAELQQVWPELLPFPGAVPELPEIQSLDPREVIAHKAQQLRVLLPPDTHAYLVEDTSLSIPTLGGLPGPLVKWFLEAVGPAGIVTLARSRQAPGQTELLAHAHTWLAYISAERLPSVDTPAATPTHRQVLLAQGTVHGSLVPPQGETGFGWDSIFLPDGSDRTFAQLGREHKASWSMRHAAVRALQQQLAGTGVEISHVV